MGKYFLVTKEFVFDSAHFLLNYKGKCERLHGHTYKMHVTVQSEKDEETGMAFDFVLLKKYVQEDIIDLFDHRLINDYVKHSSAENIAQFTWETLEKHNIPLFEVKVWETPTSFASYRGGEKFSI
jgi:6-pyruvoyltetrahydropterin/6-carboxytetrahydropterin synthase